MFAAASSLTTTTTTISSSSLGGYRGKEVVQKSRSSMMRSTTRRNNVNVVVRAEAQKTIDMNEVSFTLNIDSFVFVSLLSICCFPFWDGNNGSFFFFVFFWIHRVRRRMGRKISSSKWIKYRTFEEITFYRHTRRVLLTKSQLLSLFL